MGFFGDIASTVGGFVGDIIGGACSFVGGLFGGGGGGGGDYSSSQTIYEPDRVKAAEIESDTKIRLAHMENERIELMKKARLDILEYETQSSIALEQARAQGLAVMAQTIVAMQDKLNEVAEKRLQIIEKGSLQIIKEIEGFYDELGAKIKEDNHTYTSEKLPELLSVLECYEEGTAAHKLYTRRIEDDMASQTKYYLKQLDSIADRQSQIIDGLLSSKEKIVEQTGQITVGMLDTIQNEIFKINGNASTGDAPFKALTMDERLALPQEKTEEGAEEEEGQEK